MEQINGIDIVFENCEVISIPMTDVLYISLGGITENIWTNNLFGKESCELTLKKTAQSACINIRNKSKYDRINQYQDITHIDFIKDNESILYLDIKWNEDFKDHNKGQMVEIEGDKIYININE